MGAAEAGKPQADLFGMRKEVCTAAASIFCSAPVRRSGMAGGAPKERLSREKRAPGMGSPWVGINSESKDTRKTTFLKAMGERRFCQVNLIEVHYNAYEVAKY
jgi:hypothetical protein